MEWTGVRGHEAFESMNCLRNTLIVLAPLCAVTLRAEVKSAAWPSIVTAQPLAVTVLEPALAHSNNALPVVIYLQHLSAPRLGTESDESILRDFQQQGFLVSTLDF